MAADLPHPADGVVARRVEEEVVLVHLETNRIYSLNRTGARLWELLGETRSRDVVVDRLTAEFGAPRGEVAAEVDAVLQSLAAEQLVDGNG